ncbi:MULTISPECIES: helix-turn-helix domain-containing protein [Amycolatopsis]|uniref:Helix-turn-helix domain-containing protein n=2 Tax=Amycolatopsis TaxID=1813 RepID=A0A1I4AGD0_9PSEU|nr:helix-turn-helix transcriptional regulator [Amycolatopsis sacchari]SFK55468.1 Helix-turn-helix domain-containing protein [Amycolatopsis sacchari]
MPRHPDTAKQLDGQPLARLLRSHWLACSPRPTTRDIGRQLGVSHTTVSRWLDGTLVPTGEQTKALADTLGITGKARADLLQVAAWVTPKRATPNRGTPGLFGISHQTAKAMELEKQATSITEWSPLRIPDLLQSDDYARHVTSDMSDLPSKSERQAAVVEHRRTKYEVFLGRPALTWRVGGVTVMAKQVQRLIEVLDQRWAAVRLVLEGPDWHDGQLGPFALYDRDDGEDAVVIQHLGAVTLLTDREIVGRYRQLRATLARLALTPAETRRHLEDVLRELRTPSP